MKYQIRMFKSNNNKEIQEEVNKLLASGWTLDEYYPKMMGDMIMFKFFTNS